MPAYRLYRLDGAGKISNAIWLNADGDEEALRQAHQMIDGIDFELWERGRLVGRKKDGAA